MKRKQGKFLISNEERCRGGMRRILSLLAFVGMLLASGIAFAGDPKPDFYELRVKPVSQLPEFWDSEDGTYTSPAKGQLHTIIYGGNSTNSALSVTDGKITVESGWDWGADVNGVWLMVQASTSEGGKRGRCYAHYVSWSGGQLAEILSMVDSTLEWKVRRYDFFAVDRITQGLLRIPELGGAWHLKYSSIRGENFVGWVDRSSKCSGKAKLLERALRVYPSDSFFTNYLRVIQGIEGSDCGGITSSNLGLFPQVAPTATLRPPTATPVPPTPVPTATLRPPTATPVPSPTAIPAVARVTVAPTKPPQPTATAVPVVQKVVVQSNKNPRESLSRVCVGFLSLAAVVLLIVWVVRSLKKELERDEEKRLRQTERRKREEEEAQRDFRKYLREAEEALRQKPPNTHMASTAFEKARRLRAYATDKEKRKLRQIEKRLLELGVEELNKKTQGGK